MRRHTLEKPYECPICESRFASNGGMKVHVRNKHDGEPKKHCPMPGCPKSFTTIGNMKVSPKEQPIGRHVPVSRKGGFRVLTIGRRRRFLPSGSH